MNSGELANRVRDYTDNLRVCGGSPLDSDPTARALCAIFIRRRANALLSCVEDLLCDNIRSVGPVDSTKECSIAVKDPFPVLEAVRNGEGELSKSLLLQSKEGAIAALESMGVLRFCLLPERQCKQLEFFVGCVVGRARLVPLVELATFLTEQREYDRAQGCVEEAYSLGPGAIELHNLLTVSGLVALASGDVAKAKKCLLESIRVCARDGHSRIHTRLYGFNVSLGEKLLQCGERDAVVEFFRQCQRVWKHETAQIDTWIATIHAVQQPDFSDSVFLTAVNGPGVKIKVLMLRASELASDNAAGFEEEKDADAVVDLREATEEYRRWLRNARKGRFDAGSKN